MIVNKSLALKLLPEMERKIILSLLQNLSLFHSTLNGKAPLPLKRKINGNVG